MTPRPAILALALLIAATASAIAQTNEFSYVGVSPHVGTVTFTIDKGKDGYHVTSNRDFHTSITAPPVKDKSPTNYSGERISDYKADLQGNYLSGFITDDFSCGRTNSNFTVDKTRSQIFVGYMGNGQTKVGNPTPVPTPNFLLALDYDPSVL